MLKFKVINISKMGPGKERVVCWIYQIADLGTPYVIYNVLHLYVGNLYHIFI